MRFFGFQIAWQITASAQEVCTWAAFGGTCDSHFRVLTSTPGMAALAVVSLAAGIAANTTIFSVIYTLLLAPPVYKDFDRLVVLWESNKSKDTPKTAVAPATFNDWREHSRAFERLELVAPGSPVTVTSSGLPERANIQYATAGLFDLLGVQPLLGRTFASEQSQTANPVLLTYSFWQHRFGGDRQVVGQSMVVNGMTRTVTGILPQGFHLFNTDTDLWFPIEFPDLRSHDRMFRVWLIFSASQPIYGVRTMSTVLSDNTSLRRLHSTLLEIFAGIALFLSAIGIYGVISQSVNERTAEIAVRIAVGASRADIRRLIFGQGLKLLSSGVAIGLFLGLLFNRVFSSFLFGITSDDPITVLAVCAVLLTVAAASMSIPARRAVKIDPITALRYE